MISIGKYRKSSFSGNGGCVEVCRLTNGNISLRDSKNPAKPAHQFNPTEWRAFLAGVRNAEFDLEP
jgi:hypothetical protein